MKSQFMNRILTAACIALAAITARGADEQDLITILKSTAGAPAKWAACQQLRLIGTASSVPALAAELTHERTGHAARHALEGIPAPEAGAALRNALGQASGLMKAGLIDSLGWRRDTKALPLLKPLLSDADATVASSAAAALGRIGGTEAVTALSAARDQAPPDVQRVVLESLLQCAERLASLHDGSAAAAIYRDLFDSKFPEQIHAAAWRGLALSDAAQRAQLVADALAGADRSIQAVALQLVRELADPQVIKAALSQWSTLPPESQVAVLDAHVRSGEGSLDTVRTAAASRHLSVRIAAWQALAGSSDASFIPALVKAAATGELAERDVARETLSRLRGPAAGKALLASLDHADAPEKAELLRALGARGDTAAASVLLRHARAESDPVRRAALESLRQLAVTDTLAPLLDLAANANSDAAREPVLHALYAVCQASPDKAASARLVVQTMAQLSITERRRLLPLLAELGTSDALNAAQSATRDPDPELAKEAVRVLAQWPNAAPAPHLLELARAGADATLQILALRGAVGLAGLETDAGMRLTLLRQAMAAAQRATEKKQVLGQAGQIPSTETLDFVTIYLDDPALAREAALAAVAIAEKLAPAHPKLANETAVKVLARFSEGELAKRAWPLRNQPGDAASFIRDWVVCGPYRQAGAVGAAAVFDLPFGPEKPGAKVEWKPVPRAAHVNLSARFPDQENCAAYLRTQIVAPFDCAGALLMGSDDGIKAWLNGEVVHSNNVDRGEVPDQDRAPIKLKKGTNELMLKITQGGGGWSASARLAGADGRPIPGLLIQKPADTTAAAAETRD